MPGGGGADVSWGDVVRGARDDVTGGFCAERTDCVKRGCWVWKGRARALKWEVGRRQLFVCNVGAQSGSHMSSCASALASRPQADGGLAATLAPEVKLTR